MNAKGILKIGVPQIRHLTVKGEKRAAVYAVIEESGMEKELYYEYDEAYAEYLCTENADAFVSGLIYYAMLKNYDIESKAPLSSRFYYQLKTYFIPIMMRTTDFFHEISIHAETIKSNQGGTGVACGFSRGVDSLYTIYKHTMNINAENKLTHLLMCDLPAREFTSTGSVRERGYEFEKNVMAQQLPMAEELGLPVIVGRSNSRFDFWIDDFFDKHYGKVKYIGFHAFAWAGYVLALQKLIGTYYLSAGTTLEQFTIHPHIYDTAYFDTFNCMMLSTDSVSFYSTGSEMPRIEKEKFIADFALPQKHLQVCNDMVEANCSHCNKCIKTMMGLYAYDKLDNFSNLFDIADFKRHFPVRAARILANKGHDDFFVEIIDVMRKNGKKFPISAMLIAAAIRPLESLRRKLIAQRSNPLVRGGYRFLKFDVLLNGKKSPKNPN